MPDLAVTAGWTRVAFGDVVGLNRTRSNNASGDGFERYVGLEHIDPGDLRIRRWGDISDGTTFTNVFLPGQVLFGKRRAYQRKVAVAEFSGVCSGDIYVLEPKSPRLLPGLLPFLCKTDSFFAHAIRTSAGSLSPRTNWDSLSTFNFFLPSLEEQRRIVQLLTAGRHAAECLGEAAAAAQALYGAVGAGQLARTESEGIDPTDWTPSGWSCVLLDDLIQASAPICYGIVQVDRDVAGGVPTLAIKDLKGDFLNGIHRTSAEIEDRYVRSRVQPGDLLLSIKATIGEVAVVPDCFEGNISRDLARVRFDPTKMLPRFFRHLYRSPRYSDYIRSRLVGSTRAELSIGTIRELLVPVPPLAEQIGIVEEMDALQRVEFTLAERARHASTLNQDILHRVLLPEGGNHDLQ